MMRSQTLVFRFAASLALFAIGGGSIPWAALNGSIQGPKKKQGHEEFTAVETAATECLALLGLSMSAPGNSVGPKLLPSYMEGLGKAVKEAQNEAPKVSRVLTLDSMSTLMGRTGEVPGCNPYLAGKNKWAVDVYGVDMTTLNMSMSATDMSFNGGYGIPVSFTRTYSANNPDEGPLGPGWTISVDVRTSAGGLLKSESAPVRSVASDVTERPKTQNVQISSGTPVEAVMMTDASGQINEVQRDVDGILTPPAWDLNIHEPEYETLVHNGVVERKLIKLKTTTPEGTVYEYESKGEYPNGTKNYFQFSDPSSTGTDTQPSDVMKITKVTDRHGNATIYTYGTNTVTFVRDNRVVNERPLMSIFMPNGYKMEFVWTGNRITSIKDTTKLINNQPVRTVNFGYTTNAYGQQLLTSAATPMGRTTQYEYLRVQGDTGTDPVDKYENPYILNKITDPRGLATEYIYDKYPSTGDLANFKPIPYGNMPGGSGGILTTKVNLPNGTNIDFVYNLTEIDTAMGLATESVEAFWKKSSGETLDAMRVWMNWASGNYPYIAPHVSYYEVPGVYEHFPFGPDFSQIFYIGKANWNTTSIQNYAADTYQLVAESTNTWRRAFDTIWIPEDDIDMADDPWQPSGYSNWNKVTLYNFLGSPLLDLVTEKKQTISANGHSTEGARYFLTKYAYWGHEKYFQQKAVLDPGGRLSMTDYYDKSAAQGSKGQTMAVYKTGLDTGQTPSGAARHQRDKFIVSDPATGQTPTDVWEFANGDKWKGWLRVNTMPDPPALEGPYDADDHAVPSAYFKYDNKGRAEVVGKLQKIANDGTTTYVRTKSFYGGDSADFYGNATMVKEAEGTADERVTITQAYDSQGRALSVKDANNRVINTDYNADDQILSVTDASVPVPLLSYTYGSTGPIPSITNGMVTATSSYDPVANVSTDQEIEYFPNTESVYKRGQVKSVATLRDAYTHTITYDYYDTGERKDAHTVAGEASQYEERWQYANYVPVGANFTQRAFTALRRLTPTGGLTKEEIQYMYDGAGRLISTVFAQSPQEGQTGASGTYYPVVNVTYGASNWNEYTKAQSRILANYSYDASGRMEAVRYFSQVLGTTGSYTTTPLRKCEYTYSSWQPSEALPIPDPDQVASVPGVKTGYKLFEGTVVNNQAQWATVEKHKQSYKYDVYQDVLLKAGYADNGNAMTWHTYAYDAAGNRTSNSGDGGATSTFDLLNRIETRSRTVPNSRTYAYDHDKVGNRTQEVISGSGVRTLDYEWDALNRLSRIDHQKVVGNSLTDVWFETYAYRADGLRVQKVADSSTTLVENPSSYFDFNPYLNMNTFNYGYDGQMCNFEEYYGEDTQANEIVRDVTKYALGARGIDVMIAERAYATNSTDPLLTPVTTDGVYGSTTQRVSFPLYDGHGNMIGTVARNTSASTGFTVQNEKTYDVWGAVRSDTSVGNGQILNPNNKYCANLGHKYDSGTELTYMRARYYEAATGRFISEDPAREGANWYAYADNNVVANVDASGKEAIPPPMMFILATALFTFGAFLAGEGLKDFVKGASELRMATVNAMQLSANLQGFESYAPGSSYVVSQVLSGFEAIMAGKKMKGGIGQMVLGWQVMNAAKMMLAGIDDWSFLGPLLGPIFEQL